MNWTTFQTYNDAPTRAFEVLCNQLFENWCREEYKSELASFHVVNGAGGDGGVESYGILTNGSCVGLQAKWFPEALNNNQIGQIRNSINTALSLRPNISRYIVCIPRDLASVTGKGENTEVKRWEDMKNQVLIQYPTLTLDLWNETRLLKELQKECSSGIYKFWFLKAEITQDAICQSFEKSKASWLSSRYVPELNSFGRIHTILSTYLGNLSQNQKTSSYLCSVRDLCDDFFLKSDDIIDICKESDADTIKLLTESKSQIIAMQQEIQKIIDWLYNESVLGFEFNENAFRVNFEAIVAGLKKSKEESSHYFHFSAAIKTLEKLGKIPFSQIINQIKCTSERNSLIFLGEPGTGKTHGIAAETERLLKEEYHIPILIQARDVSASATWKDILISNLGLSNSWCEEEIWQGLSSLINRRRISILAETGHTSVLPKVIIIIDGVDESSLQDKWIERVQTTSAIVNRYPLIRFCFLSRPYVFEDVNIGARKVNIQRNGDVATHKLFENYTKAYNINTANAGWIKYALTTPLALKLFCELNENKAISYHSGTDVSIAALLKEKIKLLEEEYCKNNSNATCADQYILKAILILAIQFGKEYRLERDNVNKLLSERLSIDSSQAKILTEFLHNYGLLRTFCEQGCGLLSPDTYFFYPGIQGYFDYALAISLLDENKSPRQIDFEKYKEFPHDTYYILAIISIQNFNYLLTDNESFKTSIRESFREELMYFALRHSNPNNSVQYKPMLLEIMGENADKIKTVTNKIVLPLSREPNHALGVPLLDEFLLGFSFPAERDIIWATPSYLLESEGERWFSASELELDDEAYTLSGIDSADGLPSVYAWALASVDNSKRQGARSMLMKWALQVPAEYYKLFIKFSTINDPQIRSDIFAILMSVLFETEDTQLIQTAAGWLMDRILAPERIETERDIAIRYYATSILRKAVSIGAIDKEIATKYLPPYKSTNYDIELSEEALAGSRMGGYGGITYDLSRYVLIDHITGGFPTYKGEIKEQYEKLINEIAAVQPAFAGISPSQLILSAAYKYICKCGWNETFKYQKIDGETIYGVERAIAYTYQPKTHGSQSPVMTICEKYVWQARSYISGFLADHLLYVGDGEMFYVDDYGLLDDFIIPALEIGRFSSDSVNGLYPWHIPEESVVNILGKPNSKDDVITTVQAVKNVSWNKWLHINNDQRQYPIDEDKIIVLHGFSCFESPAGVETNLFYNSVLLDTDRVEEFIKKIISDPNLSNDVGRPTEWTGGVQTDCYITPKEICWMPWKKRYACYFEDEFPEITIQPAIEECTYNFIDKGDVNYDLPSAQIREILGITNTDGYCFSDSNKNIKAISVVNGENWRTQQNQLLVGYSILDEIGRTGKAMVWIVREQRKESVTAREKLGDFYAERDTSYVCYYRNDEFRVERIPERTHPQKTQESDLLDLYTGIINRLGC